MKVTAKSEQENAATDHQTTDDAIDNSGSPKLIIHSLTTASTVRGAFSVSVPAELTRANLDQWKRNLKLQLQQKIQKLNSLHTETNSLLSGMQNAIDTVTANLQVHQGQPEQLAKSLMQEFNKRSEAVQNLDAEICKLAKQVKELRCKVIAVTKRSKTDPGALIAGHTKPNRPYTVEDSILSAKQPNVLGFPSFSKPVSDFVQELKPKSQSSIRNRI